MIVVDVPSLLHHWLYHSQATSALQLIMFLLQVVHSGAHLTPAIRCDCHGYGMLWL